MHVVSTHNTPAKTHLCPIISHNLLIAVRILSSLLGSQILPHEKRIEHAELPAEQPLPE